MIRYLLNKMLLAMQARYDYDVRYQQDILRAGLGAFAKFMAFQTMPTHRGNVPAGPLFAARITAILADDCGPCTQLVVRLALEAQVSPEHVRAIIKADLHALPEELALVVRFTGLVLAHDPEADDLRTEIQTRWGHQGLVAIGYAIASSRVYPTLKYALGYGQACRLIEVDDQTVSPRRVSAAMEDHV